MVLSTITQAFAFPKPGDVFAYVRRLSGICWGRMTGTAVKRPCSANGNSYDGLRRQCRIAGKLLVMPVVPAAGDGAINPFLMVAQAVIGFLEVQQHGDATAVAV